MPGAPLLGVDIEEVGRFTTLIRNTRFLKRVFTPQEIAYCRARKNRAQHFAVRFAAKEAIWKALSPIIRRTKATIGHRDIGVKNDADGRPVAILPKALARWRSRISITLSHTRQYAVAVAAVQA